MARGRRRRRPVEMKRCFTMTLQVLSKELLSAVEVESRILTVSFGILSRVSLSFEYWVTMMLNPESKMRTRIKTSSEQPHRLAPRRFRNSALNLANLRNDAMAILLQRLTQHSWWVWTLILKQVVASHSKGIPHPPQQNTHTLEGLTKVTVPLPCWARRLTVLKKNFKKMEKQNEGNW